MVGWNGLHLLSNDGLLNGIYYSHDVVNGEWHHVAMTWKQNARNGFCSYMDGRLYAQRDSRDTPIGNYQRNVYFGAWNASGERAKGLLDDCSELRESISQFLNGAPGFRCVGAHENAENALAHLQGDEPDVVLMDINLPGMSGIECVSRLKTALRDTQVVMLTVYEDVESIFKALASGATGDLLKRLEPAKLLEAIQEVMAGGSPMSASIARKVVHSFQKPLPKEHKHGRLSLREREVLELLARGRAYKQIAEELGISIDTIRTYIRRIYEKLQVRTRSEGRPGWRFDPLPSSRQLSQTDPLLPSARRLARVHDCKH